MSEAAFAGLPFALPDAQRDALVSAYATPPRAYHNIHHVGEDAGADQGADGVARG